MEKQIVNKHVCFELYFGHSPKEMTWDEAVKYCKSLGKDWRLPTITEMFYIYENKFITKNYYWSNSLTTDFLYAWYFNFNDGSAYFNSKNFTAYVHAVRDINE